MESINSALKMKLAWQEAYRLRSCPGDDMLFAELPTEEITRHLQMCPACSDIRNAAPQSRSAWRELTTRLCDGVSPHKATDVEPVEGQVWALRDDLSHWGSDGNYYRPPRVLLLGVDGNALKVAQTYHDTTLAADGDVVLSDKTIGFAQSWNIYSIHRKMLDHCLGGVKREEVQEVLRESGVPRQEINENSILYWFRTSEVQVGAEIAMPAVAVLMEEMEASMSPNEAFLQQIFGTLAEVYRKLSHFKLPEYADSLIDLLAGTHDPRGVLPVVAATSIPLQVNIVIKQMDGAITIKTAGATLTESNWEDGDYYIAGKLNDVQKEDLFLVASLNFNDSVVCECQSHIEKDSPYFDIVFKSVAVEASSIENLKFILVKP
jgi:hypothetical protein